jgi:hypothetical protein
MIFNVMAFFVYLFIAIIHFVVAVVVSNSIFLFLLFGVFKAISDSLFCFILFYY